MQRLFFAAANRGMAFALVMSGAVVAHGQAPAPGYGYAPAPAAAAQPQEYTVASQPNTYPATPPAVTYSAVTPYVAAQPYPTPAYVAEQPAATYAAPTCETPAPCTDYCAPAMNCCPQRLWSISGGALLFFQDNENHHTFSYDSAVETTQLLDWSEQEADFLPGFEVGVTRFDCCTMTGWEGLYWGLFPGDSSASVYDTDVTGNLDPILDYSQLDYNGGPATASTNDARVHRLTRSSEIHNAELNRLWGVSGGNCSPWNVRTLAGFRYFRFEEGLEWASDTVDTTFTGAPNELYYTVDAENNLYGLQFGGAVERQTWGRLGLTAGAKAGVYYNDASAHSRIGGAAGTATVNNGPNLGRAWDITAEKEDVAFLAEISAGMNYQIGERWRAMAEYRVIGVSGVALPANQIYPDLRGLQDVELLNTNGSLLLHGVFVGAERTF